ncbi:MAG: hypothetical protein R3D27_13270 [Hyphomicrobiaceae bacterium]
MHKLIERLLPKPLKFLAVRFDRSPLGTTDSLADFVRTRASYIAQTSLYGYLKTRMGTRYVEAFTDERFSDVIRDSAIKVFASCLADLTVHAVALVGRDRALEPDEARALARYCYRLGLAGNLEADDRAKLPADMMAQFDERLQGTIWANAALGEGAFTGSARDLVRFAPIIDEFKDLDREIVMNSIRFRWRDVRQQLAKRLDGASVIADFKANPPA